MGNKEKPYWCETCGNDIIDGKCKCAISTAVDELDLEKAFNEFDKLNDSYNRLSIFKAGAEWNAQTKHSKVVEVIEARLIEINAEIEKTDPHNYDRYNELCSVYDELTDILTKIKQ